MKEMITVADGFQYSVNIGFDLNSEEKLKNFIPTQAALELVEKILLSTQTNSTDRASVLIGAYGKGKSHLVLMILDLLMQRDLSLFARLLPKLQENNRLQQLLASYYADKRKLLPVVISGSSTSLTQSFIIALKRTLSSYDMLDVMPETNYQAVLDTIQKWQREYPEVYRKLQDKLELPLDTFKQQLSDFDITAYDRFVKLYPSLTAGSEFNPFLSFDVVELYEAAAKGIKARGYSGIFVVYDEFSKFLEANITEASVSDIKLLQDFAEKCNRSGAEQLHLMLISHKEIANYIDKLPKQKLDGWRGVSERFTHLRLNNNFTQTYEIIEAVIQKDADLWNDFVEKHRILFNNLFKLYEQHNIYADLTREDLRRIVLGCYPLHPVTTFILPRLSERVAQNERTLFTFLSAKGVNTLSAYLAKQAADEFCLLTPDYLYDYFEPLLQKELYSQDIHEQYSLTRAILSNIDSDSLEAKLVKTISLIYLLAQFEKLQPTKEEILYIYAGEYGEEAVQRALDNLISRDLVIYLKQSNGFLRLKRSSGVDIQKKISDFIEKQSKHISVKEILNRVNFDNYLYPARYNDEKEMTRYFNFVFIGADEIAENTDWQLKSEAYSGDGIVYALILQENDVIDSLEGLLLRTSVNAESCVFVLPKKFKEIKKLAEKFYAVAELKKLAEDTPLLFDEYQVIYDDLREVILDYVHGFTHPEELRAKYIYRGELKQITRKAALSNLLSEICEHSYPATPVINNEAINKNEITGVAANSRDKIIAALLRNELESNLGLLGSGQEVSIMRSTLKCTGVLEQQGNVTKLNLQPRHEHMANMLRAISDVILATREQGSVGFNEICDRLVSPKYGIGLRKGLLPIYIAVVFHELKQQLTIRGRNDEEALSVDLLKQMMAAPSNYSLLYIDWSNEKSEFVNELTQLFQGYVIAEERSASSYDYLLAAMRRWYRALPKYVKEARKTIFGGNRDKRTMLLLRLLKQNGSGQELLFTKLPEALGYSRIEPELYNALQQVKDTLDNELEQRMEQLAQLVKECFASGGDKKLLATSSLTEVLAAWCEGLDTRVFEQLFSDGTDRCLSLFRKGIRDEQELLERLARIATGLRIEDWDDNSPTVFISALQRYKCSAEAFTSADVGVEEKQNISGYELSYVGENGQAITKRFERIEVSRRARLLLNNIYADLEAMGQAVSEQEKRQVLMEVLKSLC